MRQGRFTRGGSSTIVWAAAISLVGVGPGAASAAETSYPGPPRTFTGRHLSEILYPIGGLGTGDILLGGRGQIQYLEVANRPNRIEVPTATFFAVWMHALGEKPRAMVLERQLLPPVQHAQRRQLAGLPRFREVLFDGTYPFARLDFEDERVPLDVHLEAWNPLVPLEPEWSGYPAALFDWTLRNPHDRSIEVSIAFSMQNPIKSRDDEGRLGFGGNLNAPLDISGLKGVRFTCERNAPEALEFGDFTVATSEAGAEVLTHWYRGGWWDDAHIFWRDFAADGRLESGAELGPSEPGRTDTASLVVPLTLGPGEARTVPFYLTWFFPNRRTTEREALGQLEATETPFRNFYATRFSSAVDALQQLVTRRETLETKTRLFHETLLRSTYPPCVIDAVTANASSLKTPLVHRMENGDTHGFEGVLDDGFCCPGSCQHVWNYEQTLAFLFPSLERTMREVSFLHDTFDNGFQAFRAVFPLGDYWFDGPPAADGQFGNITRLYRDWKISGDTEWLRRLWPKAKLALEYAWTGPGQVSNPNLKHQERHPTWDPAKQGVLRGEQHNTYDINFYGPSSMTGSLYLAALKAGTEMAEALGEPDKAREYREVYERGVANQEKLLWAGEYYVQIIEENPEAGADSLSPPDEEGRVIPKYQYGNGCLADQLLGQYLAHVAGLGYLLDPQREDRAMKSVFEYNFKPDLSDFENVQRVYGLNDEAGLLLCSWPHGGKPLIPFVYSDEIWTGVEYQAAASMVYSGLVDQGLTVVKAVRDRHDGLRRNPWAEHESGVHYARAMSSWAVLLALSGAHYDGVEKSLGFTPRIQPNDFFTFWSGGSGWGSFAVDGSTVTLTVLHRRLSLDSLDLPTSYGFGSLESASLDDSTFQPKLKRDGDRIVVRFSPALQMGEGDRMSLRFAR
jgi:non-lysosomal glucosylceramidase